MFFIKSKHLKLFFLLFLTFLLVNCQKNRVIKTHGIFYLENRATLLETNTTNKNDVIKILGQPHSTSIKDEDVWIYIERTRTRGKMLKLGRNVLLNNNVKLVIISNTSDGTRDNLKNINKLEKGGLSGKPIEEKSNLLINEFYKIFKNKIKIIGVGGVDSGKSAYEKFISGASYIQLYTGMVYQGPNIVNSISEELNDILSSNGVKNIEEIVGSK